MLSVFGFFVVAGNHFWYVMPMVVPMGLPCGRLVVRELRPSPEAVGLLTDGTLTLMLSPLVGRAIRSLFVLFSSPLVRFAFVLLFGRGFLAVIYREQFLPTVRRYTIIPERYPVIANGGIDRDPRIRQQIEQTGRGMLSKRLFVLSFVILVLLQVPLADLGRDGTSDQRELGNQFRSIEPSDTTLYLHEGVDGEVSAFLLYAQHVPQSATFEQLQSDPNIHYALLNYSAAKQLQRPHRRIGQVTSYSDGYVLVEFTDGYWTSVPSS